MDPHIDPLAVIVVYHREPAGCHFTGQEVWPVPKFLQPRKDQNKPRCPDELPRGFRMICELILYDAVVFAKVPGC